MKLEKIVLNALGIALALSFSFLIYGLVFGTEKYSNTQEEYYSKNISFGVKNSYVPVENTWVITTKAYRKTYKVYLDNHFRTYATKKQIDYCSKEVGEKFISCTLFYKGCQYKKNFEQCMQPLQSI